MQIQDDLPGPVPGSTSTGDEPSSPESKSTGEDRASSQEHTKQAKEDAPLRESASSSSNSSATGTSKKEAEQSENIEESIVYWQGKDEVSDQLEVTKETLTQVMGLGESFDVDFREMAFGGRKTGLLFINSFAKDNIIQEIIKRLTYLTPESLSSGAVDAFFSCYIPHMQVEKIDKLSSVLNKVLTGNSALFIEGENTAIVMDTRTFPVRGPEEPSLERVVRGARDGFTETLLSNVALIRRRLRDPGLKFEVLQVGRRTRMDVSIAYIDDIVDKIQVESIRTKIKAIDIDGIPLADKQLEEAVVGKGWNPYPLVRYSERPDVVASHLLEGRLVLLVDTSPSAMILPTTFFDLCQHAEENRQTATMGTYLRWVRFCGILASLFLLPLWLLMVVHPELKPPALSFIGPQAQAKIPLIMQFLLVEFGVDLMRMAAVHTPTPLASAMGLIAAILVGDIAVKTGLFVNEVVLYMAVAAIGMFATPSYELGLANRLIRLFLLVAVAIFGAPGLVGGVTLFILLLTIRRSYNSSYLWPFIPFNAKALLSVLIRVPVLYAKQRPSFNKTRDNTRLKVKKEK
ncbi:spore germination protein [Paenibacillus shirakamiensis]